MDSLEVVRAYHQRTKHHVARYAHGPGGLDWENQPDPFRRYAGARLFSLEPASDYGPDVDYEDARLEGRVTPAPLERWSVARLLRNSLAISAWKEAGEARWALRVQPSSGNLHPLEAYLVAPPLPGLTDRPALLHYAVREHALELLLELDPGLVAELCGPLPADTLFVGMTAIDWREAWKYGERAYRYSELDAGHALAALALAAGGLGWCTRRIESTPAALGQLLGVARQAGPEAEAPLALLALGSELAGAGAVRLPPSLASRFFAGPWRAQPSALSPEHVDWPAIEAVRAAVATPAPPLRTYSARPPQRPRAPGGRRLSALVRARRSAVAMDGRSELQRAGFLCMLERTLACAGETPFACFPERPRVHLALFVHRVKGLTPGLYGLVRDPERLPTLRAALRPEFLWERVAGTELALFLLLPRDVRGPAAAIACQQALAGDGAFSLGMLAELEAALEEGGAAAYARLYQECGAIGQVLYLEALAQGLAATGIGCFFDDEMHALLGLRERRLQSLYHFAVGGAVEDGRLTTLPAYPAPD
jgi:SagB-type dehydrogenase family enzyme